MSNSIHNSLLKNSIFKTTQTIRRSFKPEELKYNTELTDSVVKKKPVEEEGKQ